MPRYRKFDKLDTVQLPVGDRAFIGYASRPAPETLPGGTASESVNGRMDRGTWRVRRGCLPLATDVVLSNAAPRIDFFNLDDGVLLYDVYGDEIRAGCVYAAGEGTEGIVICGGNSGWFYREGQATVALSYPSGQSVAATDAAMVVQMLGKVYLFRGTAKTVLVWDGNVTHEFVAVTAGSHPSGGTFIRMPNAGWGRAWQNRMWVPYAYDALIGSDIGDADTYDTAFNVFRRLQGGADYLVAAHPAQNYALLVLYRRSLHVLYVDQNDLTMNRADDISTEVGCVARATVQTCGSVILWLSDNGVQRLETKGELSLLPSSMPLSADVQDAIEAINWAEADRSCAAYLDNRYYLAVPTGEATRPNRVLVYNFISERWESEDRYPAGFEVQSFHVATYQGRSRLHAVTRYGLVYALEVAETDSWGPAGDEVAFEIEGGLSTRAHIAESLEKKRWRRVQIEANVAAGDRFTVAVRSYNPDVLKTVLDYTATESTDVTIRRKVRMRGTAARIEVETLAGRPEIKALLLDAEQPGGEDRSRS